MVGRVMPRARYIGRMCITAEDAAIDKIVLEHIPVEKLPKICGWS